MNVPKSVIWHHSATKDGTVLKDFNNIRDYHININRWNDIGYHLVIEEVNNKLVALKGREFDVIGAHCKGNNTNTIGICVVGNFNFEKPTDKLYEFCATTYMKYIYPEFGLISNHRHNEYRNTDCPGKNFNLDKIKFLIERYGMNQSLNDYQKEVQLCIERGLLHSKKWIDKYNEKMPVWAACIVFNRLYDIIKETKK